MKEVLLTKKDGSVRRFLVFDWNSSPRWLKSDYSVTISLEKNNHNIARRALALVMRLTKILDSELLLAEDRDRWLLLVNTYSWPSPAARAAWVAGVLHGYFLGSRKRKTTPFC